MITLYSYPPCSTCRKAKKWLDETGISYNEVHIVENTPSKEEIQQFYEQSGLDLKKFFNTSGMKYRELGLKDKLADMTESEQLELLASDGMLLKRPIAVGRDKVTVGFNEKTYKSNWN